MNLRQKQESDRNTPGHTGVVDVPFELRSTTTAESTGGLLPVCGGLCMAKGQIFRIASAAVRTRSNSTVAQVEVLSRWSDQSVRWLLVSWIAVPEVRNVPCQLRLDPNPHEIPDPLIDTPRTTLSHNGRHFTVRRIDPLETPPEFTGLDVVPRLRSLDGTIADIEFGDIRTESAGIVRSVYSVDGTLRTDARISLQLRFEVWPTAGVIQVHARLRNSRRARHLGGLWDLGDPGSFQFLSLHLETCLDSTAEATVHWKPETQADVRRQPGTAELRIVQYGSGGPAWASTNHVAASRKSTVSTRGYEAESTAGTLRGHRSQPVMMLQLDDRQLTMAVPEFWQKFPSAVSVRQNKLRAELFPELERCPHELQGGEQSTQSICLSTAPGHDSLTVLDWVNTTFRMVQSADAVQQARVFDWFAGPVSPAVAGRADHPGHRYADWLDDATCDSRSLAARRESIDEYGWRNFGDVPADHEQTHYPGHNTIISHYNNQFDLIYGGILNLMQSGDPKWHDLFDPLARHVMDIDIYHTTEDRRQFNGGLFWHTDHYKDARTATHRTYSAQNSPGGGDYGGGPSNEHNYATGLLYYYYLTGSPDAADSVRSLADWVIGMDDGASDIFGLLDSEPSGQATATVTADYHGPGRGSGNSISVLLDGWEVTGEERYLSKAEELIRRVVHPQQDLDELQLLDAEYRWSYTVCLTSLGRYLTKMDEAGRRGRMYDYVRRTLCHYGRWMLDNERPTLSEPAGLEYVTEAWAAQDFRKANVLRIAASCCDDADQAARMRNKADALNDAAWRDLSTFGDKRLTARCFSILMTEGLRDVFHRLHRNERVAPADESCCLSEWTMFIPQKTRLRQLLKSPRRLAGVLPRLLSARRWIRTLDALRRRI